MAYLYENAIDLAFDVAKGMNGETFLTTLGSEDYKLHRLVAMSFSRHKVKATSCQLIVWLRSVSREKNECLVRCFAGRSEHFMHELTLARKGSVTTDYTHVEVKVD